MYSFLNLELVHCSLSSSNCCFLTCIQISQEAGKVVWYSHILKYFQPTPVFFPGESQGEGSLVGCHLWGRTELDTTEGLRSSSRGTRDQIANLRWITEKAREFQKNICFCFIDYTKAFDCVDHSKLWKILQEVGIPDHLTCLLRNLYAGQEAAVRTGHGKTDWFQIGKGVCQGCILSSYLFNLYAEYIIQNAGLDEAQAGIKIVRKNINNFRYADDTTFMAESEEE